MTSQLPGAHPSFAPTGSPPPGVTSNFMNPLSAAPVVTSTVAIVIALQVIFMGIRLYSNLKTFHKLGLDDYCAVLATVCAWGLGALILCQRAFTRHKWDIPFIEVTSTTVKYAFASQILMGPCIFLGKASLLLLYHRIFNPNRGFRIAVYALLGFAFVIQILTMLLSTIVCRPLDNWYTWGPRCQETYIIGPVQGACNVFIDVAIFLMPIPIIWRLNMPIQRRIGVCLIFATGAVALVASIAALVFRVEMYSDDDLDWSGHVILLCGFHETSLSILCSCMPSLATFWRQHLVKRAHRLRSILGRSIPFPRRKLQNSDSHTAGSPQKPGVQPFAGLPPGSIESQEYEVRTERADSNATCVERESHNAGGRAPTTGKTAEESGSTPRELEMGWIQRRIHLEQSFYVDKTMTSRP